MISTYDELKSFVTAHLELDAGTVAQLPTLIQMAESELARLLDVPDQETTSDADTTADTRELILPADFTRMITATIEDETVLKPRAWSELQALFDGETTPGKPTDYAIAVGEMQLFPVPNDTYTITITYIAGLPPLSATNANNWLLALHPDAYLYATLKHVEGFLANDKRLPLIQAQLSAIVDQINAQGKRYKTPEPGQLRNRDMLGLNRRRMFSITNG